MMISRAFSENDSVKYILPQYKMEALFDPVVLKYEFGEFTAEAKFIEGEIIYQRSFEIWKGGFQRKIQRVC